ncbi:MAG: class I SAM-dependent rRNA methyltransferase [Granulosicoccaceae bacterium]|jgi:23S rRNA (cytosine1962-C5)-methyltransferase
MNDSLPSLRLKKREERRVRQGHPWVYSNEVDTKATPLNAFASGDTAQVLAADGKLLGTAMVNPNSLICARLFARRVAVLDEALLTHRVERALALRERLYPQPYYRLVYGESDGLPGLVVDRFGPVVVAQSTTAGMDRCQEHVAAVLHKLPGIDTLIWRNDTDARQLEGLEQYTGVAFGELPEQLEVIEGDAGFHVPAMRGQKTGWFFDQRDNRLRLRDYAGGMRVLDAFAYMGGWGVGAAVAGAASVTAIETSSQAAQAIRDNAARNDVEVNVIEDDAFAALKQLREAGERFDVINVDPPAFIKRRKDVKNGEEAYTRVNRLAMQLLGADGILVTSSCSYHLREEVFVRLLAAAARKAGRTLQVLERRGQAADHPVLPAMPESRYLKTYILRVLAH